MSNKNRNVFYIGVTADLRERVAQHASGNGSQFTNKYKCRFLVYYEEFNNIETAIVREKQLKNWNRLWKIETIKRFNTELRSLNDELW